MFLIEVAQQRVCYAHPGLKTMGETIFEKMPKESKKSVQ